MAKKKNENKDSNSLTAVYKIDMDCEGCATKIKRYVKDFQGVEDVKTEIALNKLTAVGKVDPTKLRDYLSQKTKKNVELVSPLPRKKDNKAAADDSKPEKKAEDKKHKKAPVTTAVLKLSLHRQGCIGKIHNLVYNTEGVQEITLDKEKELVIVKGTMDAKALAESLKETLKRPVEVVPPKKEKEGTGGVGDKKDGGGGKKKGGGDGGKEQGGGGKLMVRTCNKVLKNDLLKYQLDIAIEQRNYAMKIAKLNARMLNVVASQVLPDDELNIMTHLNLGE